MKIEIFELGGSSYCVSAMSMMEESQ